MKTKSILKWKNTNRNIPNHIQLKSGVGLQILRKRLDLLYPNNYDFKQNQTAKEFQVKLSIKL